VPTFGPHASLTTGEQALRDLITVAMRKQHGETWMQELSAGVRGKWTQRRAKEEAQRLTRGVVSLPQSDLAYADLDEVIAIVKNPKHWSLFEPALGNRSEALALLDVFSRLRHPVAHTRERVPFEDDLASGIAGYLRNMVTLYMSQEDPSGDYYPRIENVTDSFGKGLDEPEQISVKTGITLIVGQVVTFRCHGTDPQGRPLSWWYSLPPLYQSHKLVGADTELSWTVRDEDVKDESSVYIHMASDSSYHRLGYGVDASCIFYYRVLPPTAPGVTLGLPEPANPSDNQ